MSSSLEVVRFRVAAAQAAGFVEQRKNADAALELFRGFKGSELSQVDPERWMLVVRWASAADAAAAQLVTLSSACPPPVLRWIELADEVMNFETAEVRYSSVS